MDSQQIVIFSYEYFVLIIQYFYNYLVVHITIAGVLLLEGRNTYVII